jgi:phosphate-selective porin OprO and OprP
MNKKLRNLVAATLAGSFFMGFGSSAMADSTFDLVDALVKKGVLTEEEAIGLMKSRENDIRKDKKANPTLEVGKKGLQVKSPDGDFALKIGGRLHVDYSSHSGDNNLAAGKTAVDGTELRRARIAVAGTLYKDFDYLIETDFGGDKVSVKDALVVYHGFEAPMELTIGNQKQPLSMEVEESSNDIMFTERSVMSALTLPYFDRAIGLNLKGFGKNWHVNGGIYGDNVANSSNSNSTSSIDEGYGYGVRGSWAPIMEDGRLIHLGAGIAYRKVSDDNLVNGKTPELSYKTTNLSNLKLVDAKLDGTKYGTMDDITTGILEFSAMYGPMSFQSEFAKSKVSRKTGSDVDFSGLYAQVGYTLTGESRTYKGSDGEFKRLNPKNDFNLQNGTWGAWELAARYDQVDLQDKNVTGGEEKRITLGLNWYLNEDVRVLADWSRAFDLSGGALKKTDGSYADDIDVFTIRTQWAF